MDDMENNFYEVKDKQFEQIQGTMITKGICLENLDDIYFQNHPRASSGIAMTIQIYKCTGHDYCKSNEEIQKFIDEHAILLNYNQQSYNREEYDNASKIVSSQQEFSILTFGLYNSYTLQNFGLTEERIESDDYFLNPGWFSDKEYTMFSLSPSESTLTVDNQSDDLVGGF